MFKSKIVSTKEKQKQSPITHGKPADTKDFTYIHF
jgi:hypothetical protein